MNVVCFGHTSWQQYPYKRLLQLLPVSGSRFYVGYDGAEQDVGFLSPDNLKNIDPANTIAIVSHPFWIPFMGEWCPSQLVAMIPQNPALEEDRLWKRYADHLIGRADLVFAESEKVYLEQCFRRSRVFFLNGEDPNPCDIVPCGEETFFLRDFEAVFRRAVQKMLTGEDIQPLIKRQWELRVKHYKNLHRQLGAHETVSFLLSVYHYLLQRQEASEYLLESFEQSVLTGHSDALKSHYRFLSAIQTKEANVEQAIATFGITALTEEERRDYFALITMLQEEMEFANPKLYLLNDDFKTAAEMLKRIPTEEARRQLFRLYLQMGRPELALPLIEWKELQSMRDRRDYCLLQGIVNALEGKKHEAIHDYLTAATYDRDAVLHILELQALDDAIEELLRRVSESEDPSDPTSGKESNDSDHASKK